MFKNTKLINLKSLNLSYNDLGLLATAVLDPSFGLVSPSLQSLTLVDIGVRSKLKLRESLLVFAKDLANLTELDLSENSGFSFTEIVTALQHCQQLWTIHLHQSITLS